MVIRVEIEGQQPLEFPDNTDQAVIDRVVKQHVGGPRNVITGSPITLPGKDGYDLTDLAVHKATFGLSDKAVAAGRAGVNSAKEAVGLPRTDQGSYGANLSAIDQQREAYQDANPVKDWATVPLYLTGGKITQVPAGVGAVRAGVESGAMGGAMAGFGSSRGGAGQAAIDTAVGAGSGAIIGGGMAWATPKVAEYVGDVVKRTWGKMRGRPPQEAHKILLDTMQQDGLSPADAARMLDEARARGVPLSLSDVGDNTRGLTAGLANKPGAPRTMVRDTLAARQEGQTERVQAAVSRDLGPTTNVRLRSEELMEQAKTKAAPLYDEAYSAPVSWTNEGQVGRILKTPAGKSALQKAYTIAANEMDDPHALGFNLDREGNVVLEKVPSMKTLDYVKRGLDDVVEQYRDKTTGRLVLDTNGRAINNLRGQLNKELRGMNPKYGEALDAYGGDARMAVALQKGKGFVNKSADDIAAEIERLTPAEREQYKLGVRSALSDFVEGKADGGDKVKALIGSPKKRKALAELFGGEKQFGNFMKTLEDEARAYSTFDYATRGSRTTPLKNDEENASRLTDFLDAGLNVKDGRYINAAKILFGRKSATDKASEGVRTELAGLLTETSPDRIRQAVNGVRDLETRRGSILFRRPYLGYAGGTAGGNLGGRLSGGE